MFSILEQSQRNEPNENEHNKNDNVLLSKEERTKSNIELNEKDNKIKQLEEKLEKVNDNSSRRRSNFEATRGNSNGSIEKIRRQSIVERKFTLVFISYFILLDV